MEEKNTTMEQLKTMEDYKEASRSIISQNPSR